MTCLEIKASKPENVEAIYKIIEELKLFNSFRIILDYSAKHPQPLRPLIHGLYISNPTARNMESGEVVKLLLTCTEYSITPILDTEATIRELGTTQELEAVIGLPLRYKKAKPWDTPFCLSKLTPFDEHIISSVYMTRYEEFGVTQLLRSIIMEDDGFYCDGKKIASLTDEPTKWIWYNSKELESRYRELKKIDEAREFINSSVYCMPDFVVYDISDAPRVIQYKQELLNTVLDLSSHELTQCLKPVYNLFVSNNYIPLSQIHATIDPYLSIGG